MHRLSLIIAGSFAALTPLGAQQATFVYKLGKDTSAIEQYTRTATGFTGEVVRRAPNILRLQYEVTLGADGRPTRAVVRQRQGNGSPFAGLPTELRLTFMADSVKRENVFPDSTQTRVVAAKHALFVLTFPSVATAELIAIAQKAAPADSFIGVGVGGQPAWYRLARVAGDTVRLVGGPYPFHLRFDGQQRMQSVDGNFTTNKIQGVRSAGGNDMNAVSATLTPLTPSTRGSVNAGFGPRMSPVMIDYGRPQVRTRTVWGGELVPYDSVWRTGANAATHLATSKALTFGELVVPPGLYTLWTQHTRNGTFLIVNKQTGQWGTEYDPAQDLGRVAMEMKPSPSFMEEFTIAIRQTPPNRGAIDLIWGSSVATATFTIAP